jgi:heme-degrading monooxygenase HmoA
MYARVSRYVVPIEKLDEDIRGADETEKRVAEMRGSLGLYYLVNRENGMTMSVTLWEDERAMRDSETAASSLRDETTTAASAKIVSIERYEVVAQPSLVPAGTM